MALGGIFLETANPLAVGSTIELLFDVSIGRPVRARALVCNSRPGKGMGVKFVHMGAEDRSRLNQFVKAQLDAGNVPKFVDAEISPLVDSKELGVVPTGLQQNWVLMVRPSPEMLPATHSVPPNSQETISEEELWRYVKLSEKSTYYQLLGISEDSLKIEVKRSFYAVARKFHPDRHMDKAGWVQPLQQLMAAVTKAYNVLSDDRQRRNYDRKLAVSATRTEAEETVYECLQYAAGCQRTENLPGAIFWLRKCVRLAPDMAQYRVSLATSLAAQRSHQPEAEKQFQKAIELDPWNVPAYLRLGELYETMQLPWRALPLYIKILEIDPNHVVAIQKKAELKADAGMKKAARRTSLITGSVKK